MPVIHSLYREAGTIKVDETTCIHCGQCVETCPAEAIVMNQGQVRVNESSPFGCIACAHCMMVCPNESITVTGRGLSPRYCSVTRRYLRNGVFPRETRLLSL